MDEIGLKTYRSGISLSGNICILSFKFLFQDTFLDNVITGIVGSFTINDYFLSILKQSGFLIYFLYTLVSAFMWFIINNNKQEPA